jgi:hypothetical protein
MENQWIKAASSKFRRIRVCTTWAKGVSSTSQKIESILLWGDLEASVFFGKKGSIWQPVIGEAHRDWPWLAEESTLRLGASGYVMAL